MKRGLFLDLKSFLTATLIAICACYIYFFLILPQSWSLIDDYGQVQSWSLTKIDPIETGRNFTSGELNQGRFHPIDTFSRPFRFHYLPPNPRLFRFVQFVLVGMTFTGFILLMSELEYSEIAILFASLLALTNQALKDWFTVTAASEALATPFFFFSLWCYASGRKYRAILLFALSFLSKESYFCLAPAFAVLEYRNRVFISGDRAPSEGDSWLPLTGMALVTGLFVAFIISLPRVYTSGAHFSHLSLKNLFVALVLPPLRSWAPAFAIPFLRPRSAVSVRKWAVCPILLSAAIVLSFTFLMVTWGPFDSWYYLHGVIPFGWALGLAALLPHPAAPVEKSKNPFPVLVWCLTCGYLVISIVNGNLNRWNYFQDAKTAADELCEIAKDHPQATLFSNCIEPASRLQQYLQVYNPSCPTPPKINVLTSPDQLPRPPYVGLINNRWCSPIDTSALKSTSHTRFGTWELFKNLPK